MSVHFGDRELSKKEYLKKLRDLEVLIIQKCVNKPQKYKHFLLDPLVSYAEQALSNGKAGAKVLETNPRFIEEDKLALRYFELSLTFLARLSSQLEVFYTVYEKTDHQFKENEKRQINEALNNATVHLKDRVIKQRRKVDADIKAYKKNQEKKVTSTPTPPTKTIIKTSIATKITIPKKVIKTK